MGRISTMLTGIPARAICQAASVPASPAPRTVIERISDDNQLLLQSVQPTNRV